MAHRQNSKGRLLMLKRIVVTISSTPCITDSFVSHLVDARETSVRRKPAVAGVHVGVRLSHHAGLRHHAWEGGVGSSNRLARKKIAYETRTHSKHASYAYAYMYMKTCILLFCWAELISAGKFTLASLHVLFAEVASGVGRTRGRLLRFFNRQNKQPTR